MSTEKRSGRACTFINVLQQIGSKRSVGWQCQLLQPAESPFHSSKQNIITNIQASPSCNHIQYLCQMILAQ